MHAPTTPELLKAIGFLCCYCHTPMTCELPPTREHLLPKSRIQSPLSHADSGRNISFACAPCNQEKADRTLIEFLEYLIERSDHRAANVAGVIRSYAKRKLFHLCAADDGDPQAGEASP